MQEITHDLARLTQLTAQLTHDVARLTELAERLAARLNCKFTPTPQSTEKKVLRRRNFKDSLEAVLDTHARVLRLEELFLAIEEANPPE